MERAEFERALPAAMPRLRGLVGRLVGHPEEARDVLQEALIRAWRSLDDFRGTAKLETWLFTIATRTAIDHLRARRRFGTQLMIDACDERGRGEFLSVLADPATTFDVNEHIRLCLGCVGRTLEPEVAAALVLREMFELSNDECAEIAGVTESVHRHRLSEARTHMTREFDNLCALVRKDGPCHQCTTLRDAAPPSQRGPELPAQPVTFDDRLRIARGVGEGGTAYAALETYFHRALAERDH